MRQKDLKYETDSQRQDTLSGISDIRSDQDTQRTNISEAQKDIEKRQTEIAYNTDTKNNKTIKFAISRTYVPFWLTIVYRNS
ncbi:hypothetical protein [Levilactobacillus brevis]|uniref:hypothetical protein n=1 Tax=Levilactobacillus brevis TaxID=1580 RepID=UPI000B3ECD91|nr:hypothetical protein [Levilactobacillus brevis]